VNEMPTPALVLTVAGGLLYTAGATVRPASPGPVPAVFNHEVWHAFMVAAAACHFAMISILILR
jgi:channel protein (hemolysin III family)